MSKGLFMIIVLLLCFAKTRAEVITNSLLEKINSGSKQDQIEIIIEFDDRANLNDIQGDREKVINRLKTVSANSQGRLVAFLEDEKKNNRVKEIKTYFIFNGMYVKCQKEIVLQIASYNEVNKIYENGKISTGGFNKPLSSSKTNSHSKVTTSTYWWNIEKIGADLVREKLGIDGTGVLVGVIDEGFSGNHPDLEPRWKSQYGWKDFINDEADPYDSDNGHGTVVTGIIVAGDNSGDNIGIAPGSQFISAKILEDGLGFSSDALAAMEWMMDPDDDGNSATGQQHVPNVVNNSWSSINSTYSTYFWSAVNSWIAAGIFPCFIAQNHGPDPSSVRVPGSYPQSFCVGGVNENDEIGDFSGRGPVTWDSIEYIKPDIVAPCFADIKFCIPTDQTWWQNNYPSGYYIGDGKTSTAGPHVTGAVPSLCKPILF